MILTVGAGAASRSRSSGIAALRGHRTVLAMEFNLSDFAPNRGQVIRLLGRAADLSGPDLERAAQGWRATESTRAVAARRAECRSCALAPDTPGVAELLAVMNEIADLVEGAGMLWDVEREVVSDARKCLLDAVVGTWTCGSVSEQDTTLLLMPWQHAAL